MKANVFKYFTIINVCFVMIACNSHSGYANNKPLSMNDTLVFVGCQDEIIAKVGSIVEIQLDAIPTTGYEWLLTDSSLLLKENKNDVLKYTKKGQNSFQILHFEAIKKGTEIIHLEYKRIFEKKVEKSCDIKIEIL